MRDILEHLEAGIEAKMEGRWLPDNKFICGCGRIADLDSAMPVTNSPYAEPVCPHCWDEIMQNMSEERGNNGNSEIG